MKHLITSMIVGGALALASGMASADGKVGESLVKKSGCLTCHDMAKKKVGPSYKDVAANIKKAGLKESQIVANIKAKHATVKASDDELKEIAEWLLSM